MVTQENGVMLPQIFAVHLHSSLLFLPKSIISQGRIIHKSLNVWQRYIHDVTQCPPLSVKVPPLTSRGISLACYKQEKIHILVFSFTVRALLRAFFFTRHFHNHNVYGKYPTTDRKNEHMPRGA